jgi:hypothetical protein
MYGKIASCCIALVLCVSNLFASDSQKPAAKFTVSEMTAIPGHTLAPGAYSIRVVDHLSDRYIVAVEGPGGKDRTLFIGIPSKDLGQGAQGKIQWKTPADGASYIRGWKFPSLPALEFAYPKNDAVAVAKANGTEVPAIDPESEGMVSKASLSQDEMKIITLWLLAPTRVGPNSPGGIQATRYQQMASLVHKPTITRLPHTASSLPLIWLLGAFSLAGALGLRTARMGTER